jgi:hypothetical protein
VEISTETNDLHEIIALLSPTLEFQDEDGYCGLLTLDMATVICVEAGHQNSSYTVTATREYPHLSANDLSLIPKAITDNGRTLELDDVAWEVQRYITVDFEDIPDSYRAVARYSARAYRTTVTGYITTADYTGEVSRIADGDRIYTVYFSGSEINPTPKPTTPPPAPTPTPPTPSEEPTITTQAPEEPDGGFLIAPFLIALAIIAALLAGAGAYWFMLRHNVKVYRDKDGHRRLVAKDKISAKKPFVDLSPLDGNRFAIEIDRHAAKALNGQPVEIRHGSGSLTHKVAFEGNPYIIEADFGEMEIKAIH